MQTGFSVKNKVTTVHLEVTDKCNAHCPMCARSINGGKLNPNLRNIEMSLELAKKVFRPSFVKEISLVHMCGNFGDPIIAKDTLEIFEYLREINPNISLGIHTNGSARTTEWWSRLGKILSVHRDFCKFGIDGLEDTNHIYRRNTNWNKIMNNAAAFIEAGGIAQWEYLVFKHNEHQVEEARRLAKEMGFGAFFLKKTSRFFDYETGTNKPFGIENADGVVESFLEAPDNEEFVNPVSIFDREIKHTPPAQPHPPNQDAPKANNDHFVEAPVLERMKYVRESAIEAKSTINNMRDYLNKTGVDCLSIRDQTIFISAAGEVYPCCFLGGQVRYSEPGPDGEKVNLLAKSVTSINAGEMPIGDILGGTWFSSIESGWHRGYDNENTIGTCKRICGAKLQVVSGEYA